mmetsp:Transcript_6098/g.13908  ORF Transcript_6098/g.13908 Transcript_6098/m.13908 type:complete len:213 (+) Transcript_6098:680-1318(+)
MIWDAGLAGDYVRGPTQVSKSHSAKVRGLAHNPLTKEFATLSADGTMKFWDPCRFEVASSVALRHTQELVCLALSPDHTLVAVGSQYHVQFVDPRSGVAHSINSQDSGWGVRSLSFLGGVLSVGGGAGRLSFLDMRTLGFIPVPSPCGQQKLFHSVGDGWLKRDEVYQTYFLDVPTPNAVYTHAYDPSSTKLFVAGGPLPFGLCGSYSALWS